MYNALKWEFKGLNHRLPCSHICIETAVCKKSMENPSYWQTWPWQKDLAGQSWWRCSKHAMWSTEEQLSDSMKPKLLFWRTLSISSKGLLIIFKRKSFKIVVMAGGQAQKMWRTTVAHSISSCSEQCCRAFLFFDSSSSSSNGRPVMCATATIDKWACLHGIDWWRFKQCRRDTSTGVVGGSSRACVQRENCRLQFTRNFPQSSDTELE